VYYYVLKDKNSWKKLISK